MLERTVTNLLRKYGSDLTLTRDIYVGAPVYDPTTGEMTEPETGTNAGVFTVRGVFINYEDREIDNTVVMAGDRKLLVSATDSDTVPQVGDRVEGMTLQPNIRTYAPNGVAIGWACQARK